MHALASCGYLADRARRSACQSADPCAFPSARDCAENGAKQSTTTHKLAGPAIYADAVFLFRAPRHPYTRLLLAVVPRVREKRARLSAIAGSMPAPTALPAACRFHPRCPDAIPLCREAAPTLDAHGPGRRVRCWRAGELK